MSTAESLTSFAAAVHEPDEPFQLMSEKTDRHPTSNAALATMAANESQILDPKASPNMTSSEEPKFSPSSSKDSTKETQDYPSGAKLFFILLALAMSIFLASLDMTIVATAIPKITDDFHGLDKVSWYGSAFFMTNGGFQSTWGKAYKYFPLKTTFLSSVFVFELGSLICAVSPNSTTLIIGRAINGLGAAGIGTGAYTIIAFIAEPQKRAMLTGVIGVSYGIASVVGPLVGGVFANEVTWRWCFYINLPIGGVAAAIIVMFFHTPNNSRPVVATWRETLINMDLIGAFILVGAIVAYLLALQYGGQTKQWSDKDVIGLLLGFVVIAIVFGTWQWFLGDRAMVVPRLFKRRPVGVSALFTFFFGGSYFLTIYYLPIYFQTVKGATPTMSGVMNLPLIIAVSTCMIASGAIISSTGHAVLVEVLGAAAAVVGAGLLYTLDADASTGKWIGYQIIGGIGWGFAFQVPIIVAQSSAGDEDMSSTTSMILLFQCLGGTVFVSAAQSAFVNTMINVLPSKAPGVDPESVIQTGATEIRQVFASAKVAGIVASYMAGINVALTIALGACCLGFVATICNRWKRIGNGEKSTEIAV